MTRRFFLTSKQTTFIGVERNRPSRRAFLAYSFYFFLALLGSFLPFLPGHPIHPLAIIIHPSNHQGRPIHSGQTTRAHTPAYTDNMPWAQAQTDRQSSGVRHIS